MLTLGIGQAIISPPDITGLAPNGMPRSEVARSILDELEIHILLLREGDVTVALCVADQLFIAPKTDDEIRKRFLRRLPGAGLVLCATHDHSASPIPFGPLGPSDPESLARCDSAHDRVLSGFEEALDAALAHPVEVEVGAARVPFQPALGQNRRAKLSNGSAVSIFSSGPVVPPGQRWAGSAGDDPSHIDLLAFRAKSGRGLPLAILMSYASHIHFYEVPAFTTEAAGAARKALLRLLPDTHPVYAMSISGDVSLRFAQPIPCDEEPGKTEWQMESSRAFGESFAAAVAKALDGLDYDSGVPLRLISHVESGPSNDEDLMVQTLRIGPHALCSLPGEMFFAWEAILRDNLPCESLISLGYNRSWLGYIATPLAFEEGSYETMRGPSDILAYPTPTTRAKGATTTGNKIMDIARGQFAELF